MSHEKPGAAAFPSYPGCVVALLPCVLLTSVLATPREPSAWAADTDVRLSTIPQRVFVDNDGIVEPWPTESFLFFVVVEDEGSTPVEPLEARIELLSRGEPVQAGSLLRGPCRVCATSVSKRNGLHSPRRSTSATISQCRLP